MKSSNLIRRTLAEAVLANCGVPLGADFHTLRSWQVDSLLAWAKANKYRKPRNAVGSTARYYHAMLQRRAVRP